MNILITLSNVFVGLFISYLALLVILPYPPRFYIPGMLVKILFPAAPAGTYDWLDYPSKNALKREKSSYSTTSYPRPNIILIIADDLGINDLSGNGGVATPHIDSIHQNGVNFINGYAGHATCAPSRGAIMTGRYATRFGYEFTPIPKYMAVAFAKPDPNVQHNTIYHEDAMANIPFVKKMGVPLTETFLSDQLKDADYTTFMLGKWHLGESKGFIPADRGFDYTLGFLPGASLYLPLNHPDVVDARVGGVIDDFLFANLEYAVKDSHGHKFKPDRYMTDYLSEEAARAIKRHVSQDDSKPFFMKLSYNAVHNPLQALRSDYEAEDISHITNHTHRVYAAMIKSLDRGVGTVLAALDESNIRDNTLVIFTSDNGGAHYLGLPQINAPYRGWKATLFEGGIRVPFYMSWPAMIPANLVYDKMVGHVDIFATAVAAAGISLADNLDGVNLIPYLTTQLNQTATISTSLDPHSELFWRSGHYKALRTAGMKLQVSSRPPKLWLFNLTNDPTERYNMAPADLGPDIIDSLCSDPDRSHDHDIDTFCDLYDKLDSINSQQAKPLWPELIEVPMPIDMAHGSSGGDEEFIYWAN
jgi:arylsulfatase A-like enzyme